LASKAANEPSSHSLNLELKTLFKSDFVREKKGRTPVLKLYQIHSPPEILDFINDPGHLVKADPTCFVSDWFN
jgi:hypothetical protein